MDENQSSFLKKSSKATPNFKPTQQPTKFGQSNNNINRLKRFSNMMVNEKKDDDLKNKSFNMNQNDSSYVANKIKGEKVSKRGTVTGIDVSNISDIINKPNKEFLNSSYDASLNFNNRNPV